MLRALVPFLLLAAIVPSVAAASPQHQFRDRSFGFALRYPNGWTLQRSIPPTKQITLVQSGHGQHAITVTVLNWRAGRTIAASVKIVQRYMGAYRRVTWRAARLGNQPARVAVLHPQTEGGVGVAEGIYLSQWKGKIYQVQISAYTSHPPKTVAAFPKVYRQILGTWRFIK